MTSPALDRAPLVVQRRFPARITTEAGEIVSPRCLVVLSSDPDTGLELWVWERFEAPPRVHRQWIPDGSVIPRAGQGEWRVVTVDGVLVVTGGGGCPSCSSRLGRWKPWFPWRIGRMPQGVDRGMG